MAFFFVQLVEHLASTMGPLLLYTGEPIPAAENLHVRRAPRYDNKSAFSRLWTWGLYLALVGLACLCLPGRPLLFVTSNPPLLSWLAWLLSRLRGWRYVILIWDVYPAALVRFGYLGESSLITRLWRYLDRVSFGRAEAVITIGEQMAATIRQGTGLSDSDGLGLHVIPSWVDVDHIRPIPKKDNWFARLHDQTDKLTVLYSGNMGMAHNLDTVIQVAERMSEDSRIAFLLIGDGPQRQKLQKAVADKGLSNVTILPWQPQKDLPYSLATGDIAIVSLNNEAAGIAMPSKTYSMMAAGCALVALSDGPNDLSDTIERYACGINVGCGDIDELEVALRRFLDEPDFLSQCRHNAHQAAEDSFSTQACLKKYEQIFRPLDHPVGRPKGGNVR